MTNSGQHDVIVVGAGLAGLRAARDLAESGRAVLVLESRDRVGGRGWTSTFPDTDESIELGGAWYTEHQPLVPAEIERYGLGVREFAAESSTRWLADDELHLDGPPSDHATLQTLQLLQQDVASFASGRNEERFLLSLDAYLDEIRAPKSVRDMVYGWWTITGGSIPSEGCVDGLLHAMVSEGTI